MQTIFDTIELAAVPAVAQAAGKPEFSVRQYQAEARRAVLEKLSEFSSTLMVMATGTGKTVVFSNLTKDFLPKGKVMVLAHREELIFQAYEKIAKITGCEPDIEMGEYHSMAYGTHPSKIVCSTVQTQIAGMGGKGRMSKFDPKDFSLIIFDECHHVIAKTYLKILAYYKQNPNIKVFGCTATPDRADEKALGKVFESVAYEYDIRAAIDDGYLVPIEQQCVYVDGLDYSAIRTTAGDLNGADLAKVLEVEETIHRIASPTVELTGEKKTLIFAASLVQAERLSEVINRHKPQSARWVHGGTPKDERRDMFKAYAKGEFQYLCNVGVLTEGFDDPSIEIIVLARPTKSRSLYAQMIGRGTRPLPETVDHMEKPEERRLAIKQSVKPFVEVIDFVGNAGRHKLMCCADILGGDYSDEIVERAKKNTEKKTAESGKPVDVLSELELAELELAKEKRLAAEASERAKVIGRAKYSTAKVNPFNVFDIEPWREKAWHKGKQPTPKQLQMLEKSGVETDGLSFTHASQIIQKLIDNRVQGKCSYKQGKILRRFGYNAAEINFRDASKLIDKIVANGWKRPEAV